MHWSADYIGLPFAEKGRDDTGCDCWGLVRMVLSRVHDIALPSYAGDYASLDEREEIAAAFDRAQSWPWWPVPSGEEGAFDVALFRRGKIEAHVGLVVEPGRMLHVHSGHDSRIERYDTGQWAHRLIGFYRHAELVR